MRIGLVVQGGLDRSGRERVLPSWLRLIERLARRNDVHAFALRHERQPMTYELLGATVHDLGFGAARRCGTLRQLPSLVAGLRAHGPFDVLHAYLGGAPGALAAVAGRVLRVPSVVTLSNGEFVALPEIGYGLQLSWRGRLLVATSTRLATRLTVTSASMAVAAQARGLRVDNVPLGVESARFREVASPPGPPWRLLHVGSLSPVKDQGTLLEALARVLSTLGDVHLDLVGEDTRGGQVQVKAAALGLTPHVTFHGFKPTDEVLDLMGRAHLLVVSSRHEACGIAILEAAARGLATVGTAVGHVADGSPSRASAVPVGDAAGLAAGIIDLLRDPKRREAIARAAQAWARAHDADWTAARFEEIYAAVAARGFETRTTSAAGDPRRG